METGEPNDHGCDKAMPLQPTFCCGWGRGINKKSKSVTQQSMTNRKAIIPNLLMPASKQYIET